MERLVGNKAPSFNLNGVKGNGSEFINIKLEDYKGKWLILFFYPLDFTFVCPTEITAFSSSIEAFNKENAEVLGVSVDSEYSHKAWIESSLGEIKYPLASDFNKTVSKDYGVLLEEGFALRGLFIIDTEGVVQYSVVHNANVGRSTDEVLRVLKACKTGGLCPVNWQEGEELL
jgi:peroxiredoxin (alkyl hydroperoxide reductase subunit C)